MNVCTLLFVLVAGLGAASDDAASVHSARGGTHIIRLTNGQVVYGFIRDEDAAQGVLVVEGDEPLAAGFGRMRRIRTDTIQDRARELPAQRQTRIDRTLDEGGYVRIGELDGRWTWVSKREFELANRARERAVARDRARIEADRAAEAAVEAVEADIEGATPVSQPSEPAESGSAWARYGLAAGIALAGATAAAAVAWKLVL